VKKILLVDDDELNITIMLNALRDIYDISVALSAKEAFEAIEDELPDLIVMDIMMEETSGLEACRKLKGDEKTGDIPVIIVTAAHDTMKDAAYDAGADDFMGKPFEVALFRANIKRLIEG